MPLALPYTRRCAHNITPRQIRSVLYRPLRLLFFSCKLNQQHLLPGKNPPVDPCRLQQVHERLYRQTAFHKRTTHPKQRWCRFQLLHPFLPPLIRQNTELAALAFIYLWESRPILGWRITDRCGIKDAAAQALLPVGGFDSFKPGH